MVGGQSKRKGKGQKERRTRVFSTLTITRIDQSFVVIHLGGSVVTVFSDTLVGIVVPLFDSCLAVRHARYCTRSVAVDGCVELIWNHGNV